MMRLPARLTVRLAKDRIAQIFSSTPEHSPIYWVDPAEVLHSGSATPVSHEKMQGLMENPAPVIWIGGSEPLSHPGIAHFVRAIAQSRHCVFLETNGTLLRRRIHEFQPLQELFLTVRLGELQNPGAPLAIEGLRAARLSGFFTVVHSVVRQDLDLAQLNALRSFLLEKDVDGWLITAASTALVQRAADSRNRIPSSFWRQFSEHVEQVLLSQARGGELQSVGAAASEDLDAEGHEESVRVA